MPTPRRISRDAVLAAALRVADSEGVDALSMRRLGEELGVEAMALYKHLPNKNAILDGVYEAVLSEVEVPVQMADTREAIRLAAHSFRQAARRHPRVFPSIAVRPVGGVMGLAVIDGVSQLLLRAGLRPAAAIDAYRALDAYIIGFALLDIAHVGPPPTLPNLDAYPAVRRLSRLSATMDLDSVFDRGLNVLLDSFVKASPTARERRSKRSGEKARKA